MTRQTRSDCETVEEAPVKTWEQAISTIIVSRRL